MGTIAVAVVAPSAVVLALAVVFGRVGASSDRRTDEAFRAATLRQLARRRGDRRVADRRMQAQPVAVNRRYSGRRVAERRQDLLGIAPPPAELPSHLAIEPAAPLVRV